MAKKPIKLPPVTDAQSSLDGIHLTGIDTDPASNVVMSVNGILAGGGKVLSVVPFITKYGRPGFLIVSQD